MRKNWDHGGGKRLSEAAFRRSYEHACSAETRAMILVLAFDWYPGGQYWRQTNQLSLYTRGGLKQIAEQIAEGPRSYFYRVTTRVAAKTLLCFLLFLRGLFGVKTPPKNTKKVQENTFLTWCLKAHFLSFCLIFSVRSLQMCFRSMRSVRKCIKISQKVCTVWHTRPKHGVMGSQPAELTNFY